MKKEKKAIGKKEGVKKNILPDGMQQVVVQQDTHLHESSPAHEHHPPAKRSNTAIFVAILVVVGAILYFTLGISPNVSVGDKVEVYYTGTFENGSVFDTNIKNVAQAQGMYNPERPYVALEFITGSGKVIPGFEEAIIGMKKGEKKSVTVSPAQAYGAYDKTAVIKIPRVQTADLYQEIPRVQRVAYPDFVETFKRAPALNAKYAADKSGETFEVTAMSLNEVIMLRTIPIGAKLKLANVPWSAEVVNMTDTNIIIKQVPPKSGIIQMPFGNATVTVTATQFILVANAAVGNLMPYENKLMKVVEVNEEHIYLDANHPLAGKTLIFEIELVDLIKKK